MLGHLSCREVVCADMPLSPSSRIWYRHRRRSKWLVMWYITGIHPLSRIFRFILCRAHRVKGRNEHIPRVPLWSHMGYCSSYCNYCSQETLVCKNEKNYCLLLLNISLNLRQDCQVLLCSDPICITMERLLDLAATLMCTHFQDENTKDRCRRGRKSLPNHDDNLVEEVSIKRRRVRKMGLLLVGFSYQLSSSVCGEGSLSMTLLINWRRIWYRSDTTEWPW